MSATSDKAIKALESLLDDVDATIRLESARELLRWSAERGI